MRESGQMLSAVLHVMHEQVAVGRTGQEMAKIARQELKALGGKPAFLGFEGYPDVICISLNDAVVHGIPNDQPFTRGDLVSFDFGVNYRGMITDAAFTVLLENDEASKQRLVDGTREALSAGIKAIKGATQIGTIGAAAQEVMDRYGFGVVRDLVGHGVGHELHEDPNIPNFGMAGTGDTLQPGMTIAIEPMATLGDYHVVMDPDGWTVRTRDGSLSAHFEQTVLITEAGADILTPLP